MSKSVPCVIETPPEVSRPPPDCAAIFSSSKPLTPFPFASFTVTTTLVKLLLATATNDFVDSSAVPSASDDRYIPATDGAPAVRLTVTLFWPAGSTPGFSPSVTLNVTVPVLVPAHTLR